MYLLVEKTVTVGRSAHEVFAHISNMERFSEWFPGVVAITSLNALAHGERGKVYLETVRIPLRGRRRITLRVREARAPHFFATEGQLQPLLPRMEISINATPQASCTLTWRLFSRNRSRGVRWLLLPLAGFVMRRRAAKGLATLKSQLEEGQVRGLENPGSGTESDGE
ncbi:SRPBCC family protein [Acidovorax sp. sic0104]|uniref:SRPBCC family protein n=1 Tax=Acidovorax sp. sic0104 TaxID=2854784 RepID=UPI001C457436|nr:SRPBCC family protein [Acidovorax sp. sic0104]MBV7543698.1 SRPBCC family protein [Acidovorax sp. sic0104]